MLTKKCRNNNYFLEKDGQQIVIAIHFSYSITSANFFQT